MYGFKRAIERIKSAQKIGICSHIHPDGDSIGSLLSLGLGLEKLGKKVFMLSEDGIPKRYQSLPGVCKIMRNLEERIDLGIAVDCSTSELLGNTYNLYKKYATCILEIDHHRFRKSFGDIELIDLDAAAVGELVYRILKALYIPFTQDIAQNVLTSIIVETNSFRLPNVGPKTFIVCAEMIKTGVNFYRLTETIYWSKIKEAALLTGIALSRCRFTSKGRIAWSYLKLSDFKRLRAKQEDVDTVADEMRAIRDVVIAILFREIDRSSLRVSLRSKDKVNVAQLAEGYGGGGHFDVAGCVIRNNNSSIREFLRRAERILSSSLG